jgi:hypothetical protein
VRNEVRISISLRPDSENSVSFWDQRGERLSTPSRLVPSRILVSSQVHPNTTLGLLEREAESAVLALRFSDNWREDKGANASDTCGCTI